MIRFREHLCYVLERVQLSKWKIYLINRFERMRKKYEPQVQELLELVKQSPYNRPSKHVFAKMRRKNEQNRRVDDARQHHENRSVVLDAPMNSTRITSPAGVNEDLVESSSHDSLESEEDTRAVASDGTPERRGGEETPSTASSSASKYWGRTDTGFRYPPVIRLRESLFSQGAHEEVPVYPSGVYGGKNYQDVFLPLATPGRVLQLRLTRKDEQLQTWNEAREEGNFGYPREILSEEYLEEDEDVLTEDESVLTGEGGFRTEGEEQRCAECDETSGEEGTEEEEDSYTSSEEDDDADAVLCWESDYSPTAEEFGPAAKNSEDLPLRVPTTIELTAVDGERRTLVSCAESSSSSSSPLVEVDPRSVAQLLAPPSVLTKQSPLSPSQTAPSAILPYYSSKEILDFGGGPADRGGLPRRTKKRPKTCFGAKKLDGGTRTGGPGTSRRTRVGPRGPEGGRGPKCGGHRRLNKRRTRAGVDRLPPTITTPLKTFTSPAVVKNGRGFFGPVAAENAARRSHRNAASSERKKTTLYRLSTNEREGCFFWSKLPKPFGRSNTAHAVDRANSSNVVAERMNGLTATALERLGNEYNSAAEQRMKQRDPTPQGGAFARQNTTEQALHVAGRVGMNTGTVAGWGGAIVGAGAGTATVGQGGGGGGTGVVGAIGGFALRSVHSFY